MMPSKNNIERLVSAIEAMAGSSQFHNFKIGYTSQSAQQRDQQFRNQGFAHLVILADTLPGLIANQLKLIVRGNSVRHEYTRHLLTRIPNRSVMSAPTRRLGNDAPGLEANRRRDNDAGATYIGRMRALIILALFALLGGSVWFAAAAWERFGGEPMPLYGYLAISGGVLFSLLIGGGLMALVYYSNRHGYDDLSGGDGDLR
jgi:hypothetical protein